MNIGKARSIFTNINTKTVDEITKGDAIRTVIRMETHNRRKKRTDKSVTTA